MCIFMNNVEDMCIYIMHIKISSSILVLFWTHRLIFYCVGSRLQEPTDVGSRLSTQMCKRFRFRRCRTPVVIVVNKTQWGEKQVECNQLLQNFSKRPDCILRNLNCTPYILVNDYAKKKGKCQVFDDYFSLVSFFLLQLANPNSENAVITLM